MFIHNTKQNQLLVQGR